MARGQRAADAVKAAGGSAMDAALARIDATFSEAAIHNGLKLRVESFIKLGAGHRAVKARYGARALDLWRRRVSLDHAIVLVEQSYKAERKAFQVASAFGGGGRLSLEVLAELRLILRLIRANADYRNHFLGILGFVLAAEGDLVAAE